MFSFFHPSRMIRYFTCKQAMVGLFPPRQSHSRPVKNQSLLLTALASKQTDLWLRAIHSKLFMSLSYQLLHNHFTFLLPFIPSAHRILKILITRDAKHSAHANAARYVTHPTPGSSAQWQWSPSDWWLRGKYLDFPRLYGWMLSRHRTATNGWYGSVINKFHAISTEFCSARDLLP